MKPILSKTISNIISLEKNKWVFREQPLHQNKETLHRELITYKLKSENDFVYKTEINKDIIIYEYFFEKIRDINNSTCLITRICFNNDEMWEKIVYINNEENDIEQKVIEQYRASYGEKEFLEENQFIKNENDNQVFIRKKSILNFKNKENIDGVITNDEKIKENKNPLNIKKWLGWSLIFILETYLFGVVLGILFVITLKTSLMMALCWWTPAGH